MPDPIKVVIIEDIREVREGLTTLVNGTPGFRCSGSYRTMEEALRAIGHEQPDVILADLGLPGMSGIEGIRVLKERYPEMPAVVLTVYDDEDEIFDALCAGASGYLLKNTPPARLLECLQEVVGGGAPMSPEVARRVIKLFREVKAPTSGIVLYPHANFEGRGRNFTGAFPDLRNIGRHNSFSSLRVLSGVWEACEGRDFGGWCHLFSGDWDNLGRIYFTDEISSLRPVTLPRSGITIFKLDNFEGGSRNFTSAIADLKAVGINKVFSFQIHSGRWEVCRDAYFMNCQTFDSSQNHLGTSGFSATGKVSSLRPR